MVSRKESAAVDENTLFIIVIIIVIIIGVDWTQDNILCIQIVIMQSLLYNETSAVDYSKRYQFWLQKLEHMGAVTTSSGKEFHGFTTRTAKLYFLMSNRDCCVSDLLSFYYLTTSVYIHKHQSHKHDAES